MSQDVVQSTLNQPMINSFDALAPLSSKALFWRANYTEKSTFLNHIPLLFWVVEHARPNMMVTLGVGDAVPYFAACQAIDKLNIDAMCFGLEPESHADLGPVLKHNARHYPDFSEIVIGEHASLARALQNTEIDLLIVNEPLTQVVADEIDANWLSLLSANALILFAKGGDAVLLTKYADRIAKDGGVFIIEPVQGIRLVMRGSQHNDRLMRLTNLNPGKPGYLNVKTVFSRLGELHSVAFETSHSISNARKQRDKAIKELAEKSEKFTASEVKLAQLTDYLKAANAQVAQVRVETFDDKTALEERTREAEELRKTTAALETDRQQDVQTIEALEAKIAALETAQAQSADQLAQTEQALAKSQQDAQELATHAAREKELTETLDALSAQHEATLAATVGTLEAQIAELEQQRDDARDALATALDTPTHNAEQAALLEDAHRACAALTQDRDDRVQEIETLQAAAAEKEKLRAQLESERDEALDSAARRYTELGALTRAHEVLNSAFEKMRTEHDALKDEKVTTDLNTRQRFEELSTLTRLLEEREQQITQQDASLSEALKALEQHKRTQTQTARTLENTKTLLENERLSHRIITQLSSAKEETNLVLRGSRVSKTYRAVRADLDKQIQLIKDSGLFDDAWYAKTYPDIAASPLSPIEHFVQLGAYEGRNPGPDFDSMKYHMADPAVSGNKLSALIHYLRHGKEEGRKVFAVKS